MASNSLRCCLGQHNALPADDELLQYSNEQHVKQEVFPGVGVNVQGNRSVLPIWNIYRIVSLDIIAVNNQ